MKALEKVKFNCVWTISPGKDLLLKEIQTAL